MFKFSFIFILLAQVLSANAGALPRPVMSLSFEQGQYWNDSTSSWNGVDYAEVTKTQQLLLEEVVDGSGKSFHGVSLGGAKTLADIPAITGATGTCDYLKLSATTEHVHIPNQVFEFNKEITLSTWVRWKDSPADGNASTQYLSLTTFDGSEFGFSFGHAGFDNEVLHTVFNTPLGAVEAVANKVLAQGQWYHVAATFDGSEVSMFLDGVLVAKNSYPQERLLIPLNSTSLKLNVGRQVNPSFNYKQFSGDLDEIKVFDQALNTQQIQQLKDAVHACAKQPVFSNTITLTNKQNNGFVEYSDIPMVGRVYAESGVKEVLVTVTDELLGKTINQAKANIGDNNTWDYVIPEHLHSVETSLQVDLKIVSNVDEVSTRTFNFTSLPRPIAHWAFEQLWDKWQGNFEEVLDYSGNGRHGQQIGNLQTKNSTSPITGGFGTCGYVSFTDKQSYVDLEPVNLDLKTELTMSAWIKLTKDKADSVPGGSRILSLMDADDTTKFQFNFFHGGIDSFFNLSLSLGNGGGVEVPNHPAIEKDRWYHVAITYDGTAMNLYVDGVFSRRSEVAGSILSETDNFKLMIGRQANWNDQFRNFEGEMDELYVFDKALSQNQILGLRKSGRTCGQAPSFSPIIANYKHYASGPAESDEIVFTGIVQPHENISDFKVSVEDPDLGKTVQDQDISIDDTGHWKFTLNASKHTPDKILDISFDATDSAGRQTIKSWQLDTLPKEKLLVHFDEVKSWTGINGEVKNAISSGLSGVAVNGAKNLKQDPALTIEEKSTCGYAGFDGWTNYVDMSNQDLKLTDKLTISAWVRWTTDPKTFYSEQKRGDPVIIAQSNTDWIRDGVFWLEHTGANERYVMVINTESDQAVAYANEFGNTSNLGHTINAQEWNFVTTVYDGSTLKMYVNGEIQWQEPHTGDLRKIKSSYRVNIGREEGRNSVHHSFPGNIDEVSIFDKALTQKQVRLLMQRTRDCGYVADTEAPSISFNISPPLKGLGYVLTGFVDDNVGVTQLTYRIENTKNNSVILSGSIEHIDENGQWTLYIDESTLNNSDYQVVILAQDGAGNIKKSSVLIPSSKAPDGFKRHILNRITYGVTPELLKRVNRIGIEAYIQEQLNPNTVDDPMFTANYLANEPPDFAQLRSYVIARGTLSKRQLLEKMTRFWENHFNTYAFASGDNAVKYEYRQNNMFRKHALGNFSELLEATTKSPSTLYFLNLADNLKGNPNENYARELIELYTMGITDGDFSHDEIIAGSRIFTGWHVKNEEFFFNAEEHAFQPYYYLGELLPATGESQGQAVFKKLAAQKLTATFICSKLIKHFVADDVPDNLLNRCHLVFLENNDAPDQIKRVLETILTSPEFLHENTFRSKVMDAYEFIISVLRKLNVNYDYENGEFYALQSQLSGTPNYHDIIGRFVSMGHDLFANPFAFGEPEEGIHWSTVNQLLQRTQFVVNLLNTTKQQHDSENRSYVDVMNLIKVNGLETRGEVMDFLIKLLWGDLVTNEEIEVANKLLSSTSNELDEKEVKRLVYTLLSMPSYLFQ